MLDVLSNRRSNAPTTTTTTTSTTMMTISSLAVLIGCTTSTYYYYTYWTKQLQRRRRAEYVEQEKSKQETEEEEMVIPSVIEQFQGLQLNYDATIEEANKRRTANYYEKARDAHMYDLVVGVRSYPRLRNRREKSLSKIYKYYRQGTKSHRTVIVMCDEDTQMILQEARMKILEPLQFSHDITTDGVWIPPANFIPQQDLHVTVAIPWWWHTMREHNAELSQQLAARFKQALVVNMHHAFQIELERIVLLRGSTLVALWRCIGERSTQDGTYVIYDRHGETIDPFVALRRDIVRCFATEDLFEPLTYYHHTANNGNTSTSTTGNEDPQKQSNARNASKSLTTDSINSNTTTVSPAPTRVNERTLSGSANFVAPPPPPPPIPPKPRPKLERSNTIEIKTPGLGDHDGFIHTTLARLPLECLSMTDVELAPIHRLCREATATYCGHRMVIDRYRFLETTGAGGESNPCQEPLFDETILAPQRVILHEKTITAAETFDLHVSKKVESSATIGPIRDTNGITVSTIPRVDSLFPEYYGNKVGHEEEEKKNETT